MSARLGNKRRGELVAEAHRAEKSTRGIRRTLSEEALRAKKKRDGGGCVEGKAIFRLRLRGVPAPHRPLLLRRKIFRILLEPLFADD